jgi:hypothetical protein
LLPRHLILPLVLFAPAAWADTDELSVRPFAALHHGEAAGPAGRRADALSYGGGALVGYGLDFHWALTARYQLDVSEALQAPADRAGRLVRWRQRRHVALAGVRLTSHDQWTPWLAVEGGLVVRQVSDGRTVLDTTGQREALLPEETESLPAARPAGGLEWRPADFWAVTIGGYAEWTGAPGFGALASLAWHHYLGLR